MNNDKFVKQQRYIFIFNQHLCISPKHIAEGKLLGSFDILRAVSCVLCMQFSDLRNNPKSLHFKFNVQIS